MIPEIPAWESAHPAIVHFPIALLLAVPLFLIIGLIFRKQLQAFAVFGLVLLALGTIGSYLAVASGEAAEHTLERTPAQSELLHEHEEHGEATRTIFTVLTVILAALVLGPSLLGRQFEGPVIPVLLLVFVLGYLAASVQLIETARLGGDFVHHTGSHVHRSGAVEKLEVEEPEIEEPEVEEPED